MQGFENAVSLGKQQMRILARLIELRKGKKLRLRANMNGKVRQMSFRQSAPSTPDGC
jgi:hypothetical protein